MAKDTYMTLPPLPGGSEHYLNTIDTMLRFLDSDVARTRDEFTDWVISRYNSSRTAVNAYIQALKRLDLIERQSHRRISLTENGRRLLQADGAEAQATITLEALLPNYIALLDMLHWISMADTPVSLEALTRHLIPAYPQWSSGDQVSRRLYWLLALGCIQQTGSRRSYTITAFGREMIERFDMDGGTHDPAMPQTPADVLIQQLQQTARFTQAPDEFEKAMADVLVYLGYRVTHRGGSGEPDLLAQALLGQASYTFIVDTKSRHDGRLHDMDVLAICGHAQSVGADYVVVVAETFVGEKIKQQALQNNVVLLPVAVIADWLHLHRVTPLNLASYRQMFMQSGLVNQLPSELTGQASDRLRRIQLLRRLVDFFQRAYEINPDIQWKAEQLHSNLAMEYHDARYTQQEVDDAIAFLATPVIGAVTSDVTGLTLTTNHDTITRLLVSLGEQLDQSDG